MSDYFDRIEAHLLDAVERQAGRRSVRRLPSFGTVLSALAIASTMIVAVVAVVLIGHGRGTDSAVDSPGARQLESMLAVLRRPQTPADRAFSPPTWRAPRVGPNRRSLHRVRGFDAVAVPGLERLAAILPGEERVFLVTYRAASPDPRGRDELALFAYLVGPGARALALGSVSARTLERPAQAAVGRASNLVLSIVPDGVARVAWTFPRIDLVGRVYAGGTVTARVSGNVAVGEAPQQPPGGSSLSRETWLAANGRVVATTPDQVIVPGTTLRTPAPPTALSRRAERDPSTPNPISIIPEVGSTASSFNVYFRVLLSGRSYGARVTGGPRADCAPNYAGDVIAGALRGDLLQFPIQSGPPQRAGFCPGTYDVSVSVLGAHHRPYPPFGRATFTVR